MKLEGTYRDVYAAVYAARTSLEPTSLSPPQFAERNAFAIPIAEAINAAEHDLAGSVRLREDARALLAVDFQDLVMLPLVLGGRLEPLDLIRDVSADIRLLATEAAAMTPAGQFEVSGHRIIDALSQNWTNLPTARHGLWEESA